MDCNVEAGAICERDRKRALLDMAKVYGPVAGVASKLAVALARKAGSSIAEGRGSVTFKGRVSERKCVSVFVVLEKGVRWGGDTYNSTTC